VTSSYEIIEKEETLKMNICKWYQVCPMKTFFEQGLLEAKFIHYYCEKNWNECVRFKKEEAGIYHPDNMRQDGVIDENLS
jgi:hypothetical protein